MINPTREQVAAALFAQIQTAGSAFNVYSRRVVMWDSAPDYPALYMGAPQENYIYQHGPASPPMITLDFDIFIYIKTGLDPEVVPDTAVNACLDALESAIAPSVLTPFRQTLGNLVYTCWIEGDVHKAPGYLDGRGFVLLTIKVLVPS